MHMADALISPAVGGTMWAATGGLIAYCVGKLKSELDERKVPLMGVLGAFIFAAMMINFSIPGTGSSGHIGGGMILAILLGPYAAFLTIASVVTVQAFFFQDGGLLALGCNICNMGFFPCFLIYPLVYKRIVGERPTQRRIFAGSVISVVLGLQMGAFAVVLETVFSRVSDLPFKTFVLLMQPIHLAIGVVEGLITSAVVSLVWKARPEILQMASLAQPPASFSIRRVLVGLGVAAVFTGVVLSWFASTRPDGLEWSVQGVTGRPQLAAPQDGVHTSLAAVQAKTAVLPDYDFPRASSGVAKKAGASTAGLAGGAMALALASLAGLAVRRSGRSRRKAA
jgi:cobalt/nickel transport system permease protein